MTNKPLASILINNYNYGHFLRDAIDSALNQTYPHREVLVVDDGSTDNSREIIASYGDRIVPVLKENGGQASAFNAGFAASRGDIICFLDADDFCLPEKLQEVVEGFGDRSDLGWCFHRLKFVDVRETDIRQVYADGQVEIGNTERREHDLRSQIKRGRITDKTFLYTSTSGLCFTRSLLEQILPMPLAEKHLLNDSYLIFTSLGLSKGFVLKKQLGLYRIHGNNAHGIERLPGTETYAIRSDKQHLKGQVLILQGYWIRKRFPQFSKLANYLMASGIGLNWRHGGLDADYEKLVSDHRSSLTLLENIEVQARAIYAYLKDSRTSF